MTFRATDLVWGSLKGGESRPAGGVPVDPELLREDKHVAVLEASGYELAGPAHLGA